MDGWLIRNTKEEAGMRKGGMGVALRGYPGIQNQAFSKLNRRG